MTRFFVGQRVRVKYVIDKANNGLVGAEGVVTELQDFTSVGGYVGYGLDIAGIKFVPGLGWVAWSQEQLEPILPSGHQPSEYTFDKLMDELRSGVVA